LFDAKLTLPRDFIGIGVGTTLPAEKCLLARARGWRFFKRNDAEGKE